MNKLNYTNKVSDSKSYSSGYEIFLKRTNFRETVIDKFEENLKTADLLKRSSSVPFRVLDIGCGDGAMTSRFLDSLVKLIPDVSLEIVLIEPASGALSVASEKLTKYSNNIKAINLSAEAYLENLKNDETRYDLIIANYVFYHISTDLIGALTSRLSSEGCMMIAMGSYEHPLRKHPSLRAVSKHGDSNIVEDAFVRFETQKTFDIKKDIFKTNLNVSGLINEDKQFNDEGLSFFSFIYNVDLNKFTEEQSVALKETINISIKENEGIVNPIHNMYWISRNFR